MIDEQMSIFDCLYPKYKITKPIRLIELFSGYGSQSLALKYLGVEFEHWKTCEWAIKSIQAYKDIHFTNEEYEVIEDKDWLVQRLYGLGVSINYNEPATRKQLERKNIKELNNIYSNIKINHNMVNIQNTKGKYLKIIDTDKYEYILTYSFPCQDLSLAGKRAGMGDTSTRSGMLWEVERILKECKEIGELPQILLMENVPEVIGMNNVEHFNKWCLELEKLGYKNYHQNLIATDYGIPQTRNRTFMISILGNYSYSFPKPQKLNIKLKDLLETEVEEKYFLTNKQINQIQNWNAQQKPLENMVNNKIKETSQTITTRCGAFCSSIVLTIHGLKNTSNYIQWKEKGKLEMECRSYKLDKVSPTLHTKCGSIKILIPEATKQGYAFAKDGDGVYINRPWQKRGCVQKNKIQTLKTGQDVGVVVGTYQYSKSENFMQGKSRFKLGKNVADTLQTTDKEGILYNSLKIRKLTPKECFRLMGVKDEDYENCAKNQSNSSLYHLAGDSIVVDVLMAIFKELL